MNPQKTKKFNLNLVFFSLSIVLNFLLGFSLHYIFYRLIKKIVFYFIKKILIKNTIYFASQYLPNNQNNQIIEPPENEDVLGPEDILADSNIIDSVIITTDTTDDSSDIDDAVFSDIESDNENISDNQHVTEEGLSEIETSFSVVVSNDTNIREEKFVEITNLY
jgi:hypothetical protein